ncbi:MAG: class I SAM-dependent methyltransferase [Myxococcales bacterium]|nr:class I SAM-dependent methyltransferase [Myxococcales bacterium]MCB9714674.1 class I SAM-dependent methyltransferase [Myxococcales bacterium]
MSTSLPISSDVEADDRDRGYRLAVDQRLREAAARGTHGWEDLLVAAEGADPRFVALRLRALGLATPPPSPATPMVPGDWDPELHALDFEWYFEPSCASTLAARATARGRRVLCLGSPTVAFALLERPECERVTLVDANPLAVRRHPRAAALRSIVEDLAAARVDAGRYDAVVFDAPWYPAELLRWLTVAAHAARPGGRILFALPRPLHRPRAELDRQLVLEAARRLGPLRLEPGELRYQSPRFEHEALAAAGVATPPAWRRADLVELELCRPPPPVPTPPSPRAGWARFVLGSQVIHLDPSAPDEPGDVLRPLPGASDFRYASISTRDPLRAHIGLWTSRSRVAQVRHPGLIAALLRRWETHGDPRALDDAPSLVGLPIPERTRLLRALRTIVGAP